MVSLAWLSLFLSSDGRVNGSQNHPAKDFYLDAHYEFIDPDSDGHEEMAVLSNHSLPGPEIRVKKNDTVRVSVTNSLDNEGLTVHWHGLWMRGAIWSDGVAFGTQCPILDRQQFWYQFKAQQTGTFFWHAHAKSLRAEGMAGALIIEDDREPALFGYDEELPPLMLQEWWDDSTARTRSARLEQEGSQFKWVSIPASILHNGKGCVIKNQESGRCPLKTHTILNVTPGRTYRLRLINKSAMSYFNFAIAGHELLIVEMDGHRVKPIRVSSVEINTGQRISVLLRANQPPRDYWVQTQTRFRELLCGQAILHYSTAGQAAALPLSESPQCIPAHPLTVDYEHNSGGTGRSKSSSRRRRRRRHDSRVVYRDSTVVHASEVLSRYMNNIVAHEDVRTKYPLQPATRQLLMVG